MLGFSLQAAPLKFGPACRDASDNIILEVAMRAFRVTRIGSIPEGWSRVISTAEATGWSSSFEDGGLLELQFSEAVVENGLADFGQELAVEIRMSDGSWQEPVNG